MPFKSKKQAKWMYANKPTLAKKWQKETGNANLPEKVGEEAKDGCIKKRARKEALKKLKNARKKEL